MGQSFFGLPKCDDPSVAKHCSDRKIAFLSEIRLLCQEIKSYEEIRRMPSEIRRWWINEMVKDAEDKRKEYDRINGTRRADV